nr:unnamed protein product [Callosobruchus analis]
MCFNARGYRDCDEGIPKVLVCLLVGAAVASEKAEKGAKDKKVEKRGLLGLGYAGHGLGLGGHGLGAIGGAGIGLGGGIIADGGLAVAGAPVAVAAAPAVELSRHTHTHTTITRNIGIPVPQPVPVPVDRPVAVPVSVKVPVPVDRPYPVVKPVPYPVTVEKTVAVPVDRPVGVPVAHPVPYPVDRPVGKLTSNREIQLGAVVDLVAPLPHLFFACIDVEQLYYELNPKVRCGMNRIEYNRFSHNDFLEGENTSTLLYEPTLDTIVQICSEKCKP